MNCSDKNGNTAEFRRVLDESPHELREPPTVLDVHQGMELTGRLPAHVISSQRFLKIYSREKKLFLEHWYSAVQIAWRSMSSHQK